MNIRIYYSNRTRLHPIRTASGSFLYYEPETKDNTGTIDQT